MRGILEAQTVLDQPQSAGLTDQSVKNRLQARRPQALTKVGQQGMVRQRAFQTDAQEQPVRDVEASGCNNLPIGQAVLAGQQLQLQHENTIERRPPKALVGRFQARPKLFEVDVLENSPQGMIFGDNFQEQWSFRICERNQAVGGQHFL